MTNQPGTDMSFSDFVDRVGGIEALAIECGVAKTTVYKWHERGHFPGNRTLQISHIAKQHGLDIDDNQMLGWFAQPKPRVKAEKVSA